MSLPHFLGMGHPLPRGFDLVCLSHLRWHEFHLQPQHPLNQLMQERRVFFIEVPVAELIDDWWLEIDQRDCSLWVAAPHLPNWVNSALVTAMHQSLMDELFEQYAIANPILWYFTPTALSYTNHLPAAAIVYDRLDESFCSQETAPTLPVLEQQLLQRADIVLRSGQKSHA